MFVIRESLDLEQQGLERLFNAANQRVVALPKGISAFWEGGRCVPLTGDSVSAQVITQIRLAEATYARFMEQYLQGVPLGAQVLCKLGNVSRPVHNGLSRIAMTGFGSDDWLVDVKTVERGLSSELSVRCVGGVVTEALVKRAKARTATDTDIATAYDIIINDES